MERTWRDAWRIYTEESIAGHIERSRHGEAGSRRLMGDSDHWGSRRRRTKSSSTRSERYSARYGKRTSRDSATDSDEDADSMMHWTRYGWESCARRWAGFWISTSEPFSTNCSINGW